MAARAALVVLTRPVGRNEGLAAQLAEQGIASLNLPALTLGLSADAAQGWVSPDAFDLLVFVSGYAADCYLQCWRQCGASLHWPEHTLAATVGAASARPLLASGWVSAAHIIHPPSGVPQDSESLWQALQARQVRPRRVLIVGANEGRSWLRQCFEAQGSQVDRYAVYERKPAQWHREALEPVHQVLAQQGRVVSLLTSAQGVDAFDANLRASGLTKLYAQGGFVAIHERVASRLQWQAQRAGCDEVHVELCMPDDPAILAAVLRLLAR